MRFFSIIVAIVLLFPALSFGLSLDQARNQGLVKELPTGYIVATDPKAKSLETEINKKRKKAYQAIAKKTGLNVDQVSVQAAEKIKKSRSK